MKRFIFAACLITFFYAVALETPDVHAQAYPNRQISLIIPMYAGSATDAVARILAEELGKNLNTPVIVGNKPGASSTLGTDFVVNSKKDGYTILFAHTTSLIYSKVLDPKIVPYDPFKDLEPLGQYCFFPCVIAVRQDAPWETFAEFVDYSKKNPGKIRVCTPGQLSTMHFFLEVIQHLTGAQFTHIPHKGNLQQFLLGGNVEALFDTATLSIPHLEAGKMKFLLTTNKMAQYPKVPTIAELGYKQDVPSVIWLAFFAPAGVPQEVKNVLIPAIQKITQNAEMKTRIEKMGYIVDYKSPAEFTKNMEKEYATANATALQIGIRGSQN